MQKIHTNKMEGMVAIVTGASRGLGRAIAKEFAAEGANVVVSARRGSPTGLSGTAAETAQQIRADGGEALGLTCDVSDEEQVMAMVGQTIDVYGQIDVLVNNACIMVLGETLMDILPFTWDQSIAANLKGPYLCSRAVLPTMIEQQSGSIINIGSRMGSDHNQGGGVLYSSTKAAVHMCVTCDKGVCDDHKDLLLGGSKYRFECGCRTRKQRSEERRVGKECRSRWSPYH